MPAKPRAKAQQDPFAAFFKKMEGNLSDFKKKMKSVDTAGTGRSRNTGSDSKLKKVLSKRSTTGGSNPIGKRAFKKQQDSSSKKQQDSSKKKTAQATMNSRMSAIDKVESNKAAKAKTPVAKKPTAKKPTAKKPVAGSTAKKLAKGKSSVDSLVAKIPKAKAKPTNKTKKVRPKSTVGTRARRGMSSTQNFKRR